MDLMIQCDFHISIEWCGSGGETRVIDLRKLIAIPFFPRKGDGFCGEIIKEMWSEETAKFHVLESVFDLSSSVAHILVEHEFLFDGEADALKHRDRMIDGGWRVVWESDKAKN